jgi:hypothetical protein
MAQQQKLILPDNPAEKTLLEAHAAHDEKKPKTFLNGLLNTLHMVQFGFLQNANSTKLEYRSRDRSSQRKRYIDEYGNIQSLAPNQHFRIEEHFTDDEKLVKVILVSRERFERFRYFRDTFYAEPGRVASQLEKAKRGVVAQLKEDDALRQETAKAIAVKL